MESDNKSNAVHNIIPRPDNTVVHSFLCSSMLNSSEIITRWHVIPFNFAYLWSLIQITCACFYSRQEPATEIYRPIGCYCLLVFMSRSANVTCLLLPDADAVTVAASPPAVSAELMGSSLAGGGGVRLYPNISSICSAASCFACFLFGPTPEHTLSPTVTCVCINTDD